MSKKTKIKQEVITGKLETNSIEPTKIDQILGDTGKTKYRTMDLSTYESQLREMNSSSLREHAYKVGVNPSTDRNLLTRKLILAFKQHVSSYQKPRTAVSGPKKMSDAAMKILSEGK